MHLTVFSCCLLKLVNISDRISYLCFALPSDSAQFAVVPAMHAAWQLWAAIAAALTAIAAVITLVIRKRRAKAAKRAQ